MLNQLNGFQWIQQNIASYRTHITLICSIFNILNLDHFRLLNVKQILFNRICKTDYSALMRPHEEKINSNRSEHLKMAS